MFAETCHLQYLYPSFNVCCYGPHFTCIQKYRHGQSDLGADGNVLVVPDDFLFGHCSSSLGYPGQYFRLESLIRYYSSHIFKATDGLQFLVVYGNVSADAIGVICHQLGLLCADLICIYKYIYVCVCCVCMLCVFNVCVCVCVCVCVTYIYSVIYSCMCMCVCVCAVQ